MDGGYGTYDWYGEDSEASDGDKDYEYGVAD